MNLRLRTSIAHLVVFLVLALASAHPVVHAAVPEASRDATQRAAFEEAWRSARSGRRERFEELGPSLKGYVLYPYWQYEDYRHRRAQVAPETMDNFLDWHDDWAFTRGLRTAWLKTLGREGRWHALVDYGEGSRNTEVRCYVARARLKTGNPDGVLEEARELWTVGHSQPDACDPLFAWFIDADGVTSELAWERIRLAMASGNSRLTVYLARFLPKPDRTWLERWQRLDRDGYRHLGRAAAWTDQPLARMIAAESLRRLARLDPERALELYPPLAAHFSWNDELVGDLAREVGV